MWDEVALIFKGRGGAFHQREGRDSIQFSLRPLGNTWKKTEIHKEKARNANGTNEATGQIYDGQIYDDLGEEEWELMLKS